MTNLGFFAVDAKKNENRKYINMTKLKDNLTSLNDVVILSNDELCQNGGTHLFSKEDVSVLLNSISMTLKLPKNLKRMKCSVNRSVTQKC